MPDLNPEGPAPFFVGLQTFNKFPYAIDAEELKQMGADIAIIGAPFDSGAVIVPGARFGPNAIRAANYFGSPIHSMYHLGMDIQPMKHLKVADFGDANCPPNMVEVSMEAIQNKVKEALDAGALPIILGGDHTIVLPDITAVAEKYGYKNVGALHFDAHADTFPSSYGGSLINHGTPVRRLIENGVIDGKNYIEVGLRGYLPPPSIFGWMKEQGMRWHLMAEIEERGLDAVLEDAINQALDGPEHVFLSIDIDVLDPSYAPGTGGLEPGGFTTMELLRAVRHIVSRIDIVGMDVSEVLPAWDTPGNITAVAANRVVMEAISAIAKKKAEAGNE